MCYWLREQPPRAGKRCHERGERRHRQPRLWLQRPGRRDERVGRGEPSKMQTVCNGAVIAAIALCQAGMLGASPHTTRSPARLVQAHTPKAADRAGHHRFPSPDGEFEAMLSFGEADVPELHVRRSLTKAGGAAPADVTIGDVTAFLWLPKNPAHVDCGFQRLVWQCCHTNVERHPTASHLAQGCASS